MADQTENASFDQEDLHRSAVEECYRRGLAVSDISKIIGIGWTEIGEIVLEGINAGSLPKAEEHRKIRERHKLQEIDLNTLAMVQTIAKAVNQESKEKRQKILQLLISLTTVLMIGLGLFVPWNNHAHAHAKVLSEVKNVLKNHQWVKSEKVGIPLTQVPLHLVVSIGIGFSFFRLALPPQGSLRVTDHFFRLGRLARQFPSVLSLDRGARQGQRVNDHCA